MLILGQKILKQHEPGHSPPHTLGRIYPLQAKFPLLIVLVLNASYLTNRAQIRIDNRHPHKLSGPLAPWR
jgi:hypothetical protein